MAPQIILLSWLWVLLQDFAAGSSFTDTSSGGCVCPGDTIMFECTVSSGSGGTTVWQGSAFDCARNEILLRHSQFESQTAIGECNNGAITGRGINMLDNSFTSQLNVSVTTSLQSKTVECVYDNGTTTTIGNGSIIITTGTFAPPSNIHLHSAGPRQLTFQWNSPTNSCSALSYSITSSGCGTCPSDTTHKSLTCNIDPEMIQQSISGQTCMFSVATRICGNLPGNSSTPVLTNLQVPTAPHVDATPYYSAESNLLIAISVTFNKTNSFDIANNVDGSAISYTITYTDTLSGTICSSVEIQAPSCNGQACGHWFEVSLSSCVPSADINITVFATNVLGSGQTSRLILIESINRKVKVIVHQYHLTTVKCKYLQTQTTSIKSCVVGYGPRGTCTDPPYTTQVRKFTNSTIDVALSLFPKFHNETQFCYSVTASNGTFIVAVIGTFYAACSSSLLSDGTQLIDNIMCDAPFNSVGIKDGIVCYQDTNVGSSAFQYCINCGFRRISGMSIRTCLANGTWNGSISNCDCLINQNTTTITNSDNAHFGKDTQAVIPIIICMAVLVIAIIIASFVTTTVILSRSKARIKVELEDAKVRMNAEIYEEIDSNQISASPVDTNANIAYAEMAPKLQ